MKGKNIKDLITLIFKAVALAMGVAVTALLIMNKVETNSALMMLSIGVATSSAALLMNKNTQE